MAYSSLRSSAVPLSGRRILLTRPETALLGPDVAGSSEGPDMLTQQLMDWGAEVYSLPLVEIQPAPFLMERPLAEYDWIFFTSKNAVRVFFQDSNRLQGSQPRIAVVGPSTAQYVEQAGYPVDFISSEHHAEGAAKSFCQNFACADLQVLWPCGNLADPVLQAFLESAGATVSPLVVYQTSLRTQLSYDEYAQLQSRWDMLVFTSPSAIESWCTLRLAGLPVCPVACLGPKTAQTANQRLGRVDVQARPHTLSALAQAILAYFVEGGKS